MALLETAGAGEAGADRPAEPNLEEVTRSLADRFSG